MVWSQIAQPVPFQMGPDLFHGVEFWSIGRQLLQEEARKVLHQPTDLRPTMHRPAVPDEDHVPAQVPQQLANEPGNSRMVETVVGERAEIETQIATPGGKR